MNDYQKELYQLINDLNYHTKLYDEGHPNISDKEWDDMYFRLQYLESAYGIYDPESPTQKISYQVVNELKKVKHNHSMLSLAKTKDWHEFLRYFSNINASKDVVGMLKLDGLTCSLRYIDGKLVSAETRGNGETGEDILHNALVLPNIPKKIDYEEELIVDGEIICDKETFKQFENEYANPRNFAAGSIRLLDSKECGRRGLKFILWNVIKGPHKKIMDNFNDMTKLGFTVTPWTSSFDWDAKEFLIEKAEEYGYPIDGLVGRFNDQVFGESLGATGHHSRAAYAFKFYDEEYETQLISIDWTMGRTGILTPVAVFDKVDTGDSIIERASLHNLSIMRELLGLPYERQNIIICKMNDIIPQVVKGERTSKDADYITIPKECPICGEELKIECEVDSEILKCINPQCFGQLVNRLDHFCGKKGLDIRGLSKATLTKLVDLDWVSEPADIFNLQKYRNEWIKLPGFGEKSVDKILIAIENARTAKLESFLCSLGIPLVGISLSKEIVKHIKTYEEFRNKVQEKWDFTKLDNVSYEKADKILNFNYDEADRVFDCMFNVFVEETAATAKTLDGKKIVITGSLKRVKNRTELQALIEAAGGRVVGSISRNTDILVNNDIESTSSKNVSAKKLGIPIITEEELFNNYLTF